MKNITQHPYFRYLTYALLVISIGYALMANRSVSYQKSQTSFWEQQYESSRLEFESKKSIYEKNIKELRSRDTKVVEIITKPDGTIINRTEETTDRVEIRDEESSSSESETSSEENVTDNQTKSEASAETHNSLSRYAISAFHPADPFDVRNIRFDVGARLGNLPLWGVVGSDGKFSNVYFGVRYEF